MMTTGGWIGVVVGLFIVGIIAGLITGFIISKKMQEKAIRENPPISEDQIRAMYAQMGRKPSEQQIKQMMARIKNSGK